MFNFNNRFVLPSTQWVNNKQDTVYLTVRPTMSNQLQILNDLACNVYQQWLRTNFGTKNSELKK